MKMSSADGVINYERLGMSPSTHNKYWKTGGLPVYTVGKIKMK